MKREFGSRELRAALAIMAAGQANWAFVGLVYWLAAEGNPRALATRGHDLRVLLGASVVLTLGSVVARIAFRRVPPLAFGRITNIVHIAGGFFVNFALEGPYATFLTAMQFGQGVVFATGVLSFADLVATGVACGLGFLLFRTGVPAGERAFLAGSTFGFSVVGGWLSHRQMALRQANREAREKLAVATEELEIRVAERTLALASTNNAIQRFVPREFLHALGHDDVTTARLGDAAARSITVLFADIRNFTASSERMSPEETFAFLNSCLSRLGPHVRAQSGFVDKYIGDAIMALFPRDPRDAVRAAIAMQSELRRGNEADPTRAPVAIGVGIHLGRVMMGTIGEEERFEATVISDAVNLTARLESLTKQLRCAVLISEDVEATLDAELRTHTRRVGTFVVKGKIQPVVLFEVFASDAPSLRATKVGSRAGFERMLEVFATRGAAEARGLAAALHDESPDDGPAAWWCDWLAREGAPNDEGASTVGGVVRLEGK